jgi:hypothetical protein
MWGCEEHLDEANWQTSSRLMMSLRKATLVVSTQDLDSLLKNLKTVDDGAAQSVPDGVPGEGGGLQAGQGSQWAPGWDGDEQCYQEESGRPNLGSVGLWASMAMEEVLGNCVKEEENFLQALRRGSFLQQRNV